MPGGAGRANWLTQTAFGAENVVLPPTVNYIFIDLITNQRERERERGKRGKRGGKPFELKF